MPRGGAQVRGNVPNVRIATWSKERSNNIETVNPQVRSQCRQYTRKEIKKEMKSNNVKQGRGAQVREYL